MQEVLKYFINKPQLMKLNEENNTRNLTQGHPENAGFRA